MRARFCGATLCSTTAADGHPDLQGTWNNATITPFERPEKYGQQLVLSGKEADELEQAEAAFNATADAPTDPKTRVEDLPTNCGRGFSGANCGYNNFWVDPGTKLISINGERRSSMLVDPANGRMPPLTDAGKQRAAQRMAAFRRGDGGGAADGPEMRSLGERCILSFGSSAGPPMIPLLYNNNYQIVQTADSVMILVEMVHDARVVRLNSKHRPSNVRTWMGDSDRLVGGRDAGRGDHELPPRPELPRQQPEPQGDGALHAHRIRTRSCITSPSKIRTPSRSPSAARSR